jgi:hypothetical protein
MLLQIPPVLVFLWFITIIGILVILLALAIQLAVKKNNEEGTAVKLPQEWTRADIIGVVTVVVAIIGVVVAIAGIIIAFFMPELRRRLR